MFFFGFGTSEIKVLRLCIKHTVLSSVFGSQQPGDTLGSAMLHNSQTKILVVERRKKSMKNKRKIHDKIKNTSV